MITVSYSSDLTISVIDGSDDETECWSRSGDATETNEQADCGSVLDGVKVKLAWDNASGDVKGVYEVEIFGTAIV